jgi:tetratricopeptide (TPR) repeat protein
MSRELLSAHLRALLFIVFTLSWIGAHAQSQQLNATCAGAPAQSGLLNEVHTIADASQAVPLECSFDVSVAGTYQVTLTDLGVETGSSPAVPAPLAVVKLAVTSGSTIVGTPLTAAGSMQFAATAGTYVIRVTGLPGVEPASDPNAGQPIPGSGPIGIQVTNVADSSLLASFSATLALPSSGLPSGESVIDDSFTVSTDGSYVVTLADFQLPQPLPTLKLLITTDSGTFVTNPPLAAAGSTTVTLQHGVAYRILAVGQADSTVNAGLYGATVAPVGGGAPVYSKLVPIGTVTSLATVTLSAGGTYSLALSDLGYPAQLTSLGAVIANNGQVAAQLAAAGTSPTFTAAAGNYQVFGLAVAATSGSYTVTVNQPGGSPALSIARAVSPVVGATPSAFSFDTTVPSAGSYTFDLTDFAFPTAFTSLGAVVVQNGAILGKPATVAGTQTVTAAAGPLSVLVFSQPGTGGGMFGTDLTAGSGAAAPVFETTQGVGQLFTARQVSITTPGTYAVNVSDVKFPAALSTFAVIVTRGSAQVGYIYGGGAFTFDATAGNYFINFIATPGGDDKAGTYSLSVAPGPTVNLTSDITSVNSGGIVHLTWSSVNTDSCAASGGWTGSQPVSGTATSAALTADTTFTLTCSGGGTTSSKSVSITVTAPAPASSGGGGGGNVTVDLLLLLLGATAYQVSRRCRHALVIGCTLLAAGCGGAQSRLASHMHRGREYYSQGNYPKANLEFRNAMQIAPRDPDARVMAGHTAERLGQYSNAVSLYQSVVDATPANVEARISLARLLILAGASKQAMDTIKPAIQQHPDDAQLLTLQAAAKLGLGDEAAAQADVDRALVLQPANEDAVALRAGIYRRKGDISGATGLVLAAVQKAPSSIPLREMLASLYATGNEPAKAEEQLRKLVEMNPKQAQYRGQLAVFYAGSGRLDDAQHVLEESVRIFPDSDDSKLTLVDFLATRRSVEQGEKALRGYIAQQPRNDDLRLHLGTLLEHAGKYREAIDAYKEVIRDADTEPKGIIALDRIAAIEVAQQKFEDAGKLVARVLSKNPRDNDALKTRGEIALVRNDPVAAIADFRAVLRDQPRSVGMQRMLARAYLANAEPALAEGALRAAQEVAPADSVVRIELARVLLQTQRADQAIALLEEGTRAAPKDMNLRQELIRAYLAKRDFAAARSATADLVSANPDSAAAFYLAGLAAQGEDRSDDAQKNFEHALAIQPRALQVLSALAHLQVARGRPEQAIALVQDAAGKDVGNAFAWNLLGELYLGQHDLPAAIDALQHAIGLSASWWVPHRNLALAKLAANDSAGATAEYDVAISKAPQETGLATELALLFEKQGHPEQAIARYEAAYHNNPRSRLVANNLAMLLVTYRKDRASLDRARDLTNGFETSNDGNLLDTTGWVRFKRAEYADALAALEQAAQRSPDSRVIHYHLGMAELQAGRADQARVNLQTAVSGAADFQGADEARTALAALRGHTG